jgi:osmotically-inducible protein OsmY
LGCHSGHQGGPHNQPAQFSTGAGASPGTPTATNRLSDPVPADNTEHNKRDQATDALTPFDQGENRPDLDLTRRIRHAVVSNAQLSMNAKNVKIITVNGKVTLRGPVATQQEKQTIEDIAKRVGATEVDDQLDVENKRP